MNIAKNLVAAVLMTIVTTLILGVIYPLAITAIAQVAFPSQANGQLIERDGKVVGSRIIGQGFSSPGYFHSRPSAAGTGYDAANSAGSNLGPTNKKLIDAVTASMSFLFVGPRLVPAELVASYPMPAADGRERKYPGEENP